MKLLFGLAGAALVRSGVQAAGDLAVEAADEAADEAELGSLANLTALGAAQYWRGVNFSGKDHMMVLKALQKRCKRGHRRNSYKRVWQKYELVNAYFDEASSCEQAGEIGGLYSSKCWTYSADQCGQNGYQGEGDCYNREHSWPKSWWGGSEKTSAYVDLFHLFPADGFVNGLRSNLPLGEVKGRPSYKSTNGAKIGRCKAAGIEKCFEPGPGIKGNLARAYMYMSMRYADEFTCCNTEAVDRHHIKPWLLEQLLRWHVEDPVTHTEQAFNDQVERNQGNRNPFIDFPQLAQQLYNAGRMFKAQARAPSEELTGHADATTMRAEFGAETPAVPMPELADEYKTPAELAVECVDGELEGEPCDVVGAQVVTLGSLSAQLAELKDLMLAQQKTILDLAQRQ